MKKITYGSRNGVALEVDLDDMSSLDLALAELERGIAEVKSQIDQAKHKAAATGEYADRKWFDAACQAVRRKGQLLQLIQRRRAELRRKRADTTGQKFIDAARRRLDPEVFSELMEEAQTHNGGRE